jgi:uncharacterized protein (TIGR04141 family)
MTATNKLTIYLIKDKFKIKSAVIKRKGDTISIAGIGTFYTEPSQISPPSWFENFFKEKVKNVTLFVASARGVLLTTIKYKQKKVMFAVSFGTGFHMLNQEAIEEGFGLKVTLNSVDKDSIRSIEKSSIGANSKRSREQMTKSTNATEFGIDVEQDLLRAVTGSSKYFQLGKTISGADALSASVKVDIDNIKEFLSFCYAQYLSKEYQKHFDWVDQIHHLKNPILVSRLEETLVKKFNKRDFKTLWMVIPDLMDWNHLQGFKFFPGQAEISDDIDIQIFRDAIGEIEDLHTLTTRYVKAMSAVTDIEITHWSAFKCLYGEISHYNRQYLLNSGKWYEIDKNFVTRVNNIYNKIRLSNLTLLDYDHTNEGEYNKALADSSQGFHLMDKKNIRHGDGKSTIEFCDVFSKDRKIIHVKHYGASAVLSHLFQQGMNSAEYLNADPIFRKKLNEVLPPKWQFNNPNAAVDTAKYEIIFAIISRDPKARPEIPFFSKVSLKNVVRRLQGYRYHISLKKITSLKN